MAALGFTLDVAEMAALGESDFQPVPAGWYQLQTTSVELVDTKAGTGKYIKIKFIITGPSYEGRVIFANLNILNPSETAQNIGRKMLFNIMSASGITTIEDTDQLIGVSIEGLISIAPANGKYAAGNVLKKVKKIEGETIPAQTAPETPSSDTIPW